MVSWKRKIPVEAQGWYFGPDLQKQGPVLQQQVSWAYPAILVKFGKSKGISHPLPSISLEKFPETPNLLGKKAVTGPTSASPPLSPVASRVVPPFHRSDEVYPTPKWPKAYEVLSTQHGFGHQKLWNFTQKPPPFPGEVLTVGTLFKYKVSTRPRKFPPVRTVPQPPHNLPSL